MSTNPSPAHKLESLLQTLEQLQLHADQNVGDPELTVRSVSSISTASNWSPGPSTPITPVMPNYGPQSEAATLNSILTTAVLSGLLCKLKAPVKGSSDQWEPHYVVLGTDGTLHLFPVNPDNESSPLSSLSLSACQPFVDDSDPSNPQYILRVQSSIAPGCDGFSSKRNWTLASPDETTFTRWSDALRKNLVRTTRANGGGGGNAASLAEFRRRSRSQSLAADRPPKFVGVRMGSSSSLGDVDARGSLDLQQERQRKQYLEYLEVQKMAAENHALLKRAAEERAREECAKGVGAKVVARSKSVVTLRNTQGSVKKTSELFTELQGSAFTFQSMNAITIIQPYEVANENWVAGGLMPAISSNANLRTTNHLCGMRVFSHCLKCSDSGNASTMSASGDVLRMQIIRGPRALPKYQKSPDSGKSNSITSNWFHKPGKGRRATRKHPGKQLKHVGQDGLSMTSQPIIIHTGTSHVRSGSIASLSASASKLESLLSKLATGSEPSTSPTHATTTTNLDVPLRRSRSAMRLAGMGVTASLGELQTAGASLGGFLAKQGSDGNSYRQRFVLLTQADGCLFLFKNNNTDNRPITFLPLASCHGFMETSLDGHTAFVLRVTGDGRAADSGQIVRRCWVFHAPDEAMLGMWVKAIQRTMEVRSTVVTSPIMEARAYSQQPQRTPSDYAGSSPASSWGGTSTSTTVHSRYSGVGGSEDNLVAVRDAAAMRDMWLRKEREEFELAELDAKFQREMAEHRAMTAERERMTSSASNSSSEKKKAVESSERARKRAQTQMAAKDNNVDFFIGDHEVANGCTSDKRGRNAPWTTHPVSARTGTVTTIVALRGGEGRGCVRSASREPRPGTTTATTTPPSGLTRLDSAVSVSMSTSSKLESLLQSLNDFGPPQVENASLAVDTAFFRRGSSYSSNSSFSRRSRSVSRRDSDAVTPTTFEAGFDTPITLEYLQNAGSTISGNLLKLQLQPVPRWTERCVILSDDATLYLFRSNSQPTATPLTYLPLTQCMHYFDADEGAWILKVTGDGITPEGTPMKRNWLFRFDAEPTLKAWHAAVSSILEQQQQQQQQEPTPSSSTSPPAAFFVPVQRSRSMSVTGRTYSDSLYGASYESAGGFSASGNGGSPAKSTYSGASAFARPGPSSRSINTEEREAQMKAMHAKYVEQQRMAAEQFAARKEHAELKRVEQEAQAKEAVALRKTSTPPPAPTSPVVRKPSRRPPLFTDLDLL
ncbi:hypothetical protein BC830DRAFT_1077145 [Chytriomyces sp. MP71]|nr:hypothetical protein BC830DRAFT_1077145 [Chytriomyces sp. MP71]